MLTTVARSTPSADWRRRANSSRSTLAEVLAAVTGREPVRACRGPCRRLLPPGCFSKSEGERHGRLRRCRTCERARVKAWEERKAEEHGGKRRASRR